MKSPRVLLTNICLVGASGTEWYTYDLARQLQELDLRPMVYSPKLGLLAERLVHQGIPVVDRIERLAAPPDIIQGHHLLETMTALLHFPHTPGIFVCHDASAWHSRPLRFPRIRRYVAVDEACRDRMCCMEGIPEADISLIPNGVDLARFRPRAAALPARPRRALLFSNYADQRTLAVVRAACAAQDVVLEGAGQSLGGRWERPEECLANYDLVFAKGRCAWEALAVGAAVVVCDESGSGPLVTSAHWEELAARNFGRRLLVPPLDVERLRHEIARYDAADAACVSQLVRRRADVRYVATQLAELYEEVLEHEAAADRRREASSPSPLDEWQAAAQFVQEWSFLREQTLERPGTERRPRLLARLHKSLRKRVSAFLPSARPKAA
jgi:hypothetical protein